VNYPKARKPEMNMAIPARSRRILSILVAVVGLGLVASDVYAIIGRPLTPLSYAGVARRTVRRAYFY
jgi:hypothetical protein